MYNGNYTPQALMLVLHSLTKVIIMVQRLKSWESPRKEGRNKKGKGGSARARQLKKQQQMLRKKLKGEDDGINKNQKDQRGKIKIPSLFLGDRSVLKLGFSTKFGFQKPGFYLIF